MSEESKCTASTDNLISLIENYRISNDFAMT